MPDGPEMNAEVDVHLTDRVPFISMAGWLAGSLARSLAHWLAAGAPGGRRRSLAHRPPASCTSICGCVSPWLLSVAQLFFFLFATMIDASDAGPGPLHDGSLVRTMGVQR